jgi:cullin 1
VSHLGRVEIKGIYGQKIFTFVMTPIQAIIFLNLTTHFQSIEEIEKLSISKNENISIHSVLLSLKDLVVQQDNKWSINTKFNYNKRVVRLPIPIFKKKTKKDDQDSSLVVQRGYIIDCIIVRTMKSHRIMKHNDLIVNITANITTFKPDVKTIKKQIESLIERDYIERDLDNQSYKYVL